ncbi:Hpt domain-containing protein [Desulfocurvus sp. DL9XJH121]
MTAETSPTLDTQATLVRLKGDTAFLNTLLEVFLEDLPRKLEILEPAVRDKDMPTVLRTAHSLKGACATIGALALGEAAEALERAAREQDALAVDAAHAPIAALAGALSMRLMRELD